VLAERSLNREHTDARRGIHDGNSRDGRSADPTPSRVDWKS
jgi:hypothetical protein